MIVKRFYDGKLAQASYLIGCAGSGDALVVDPNRDIDRYVEAAEAEGLRIRHVTETHIHADFVSGSRELAHHTGARLYLSGEGGEAWRYGFAEAEGAVLLRDGDTFAVGNVRIRTVHTPGHTPEHLSFLVTDRAAADEPMAALTGDGPRVLGERADPVVLADERLAGVLATGATVIDTRPADDYAAGHVPGTLNLPVDRSFNTWAGWLVDYDEDFNLLGDEATVSEAVRDLAMVGLDRVAGAFRPEAVRAWSGAHAGLSTTEIVSTATVAEMWENPEVTVLDIRGEAEWRTARIPGALHIPLGYLPDRMDEVAGPVVVHCESGSRSAIAASLLKALGVDDVVDYRGGMQAWQEAGLPLERSARRRPADASPVEPVPAGEPLAA